MDAERRVLVKMTLTSPACPSAQQIPSEVRYKVKALPGVTDAWVEIVWEPPWGKERMSEAAKLQLGFFYGLRLDLRLRYRASRPKPKSQAYMSDLSDLYQEVILDHNRRPRNFGPLEGANREAQGAQPALRRSADRVPEARRRSHRRHPVRGIGLRDLEGVGVAHDRRRQGTNDSRGDAIFERFQAMITAPLDQPSGDPSLGKLAVLGGVREFPVRIKCASLPWHTLKAAIAASHDVAVTE